MTLIKKYWKLVVAVLLVLFFVVVLWNFPTQQKKEDEDTKTTVITATEAENVNALRNELNISKQNAEILQKRIDIIQHTSVEPSARYEVAYEKGQDIAAVISDKIAQRASETAPEALEKTDKTVVVQPDPEKASVNVYKINTYRNWEFGTGVGVHDNNAYIPISLQRNYDKTHSIVIEGHYDLKEHKVNGAEVQWKIRF